MYVTDNTMLSFSLEKRAKDAEVQMRQLARDAREEVRNSFRHVARNLTAVSAFASGKDKPPLPPKYVCFF